MGQTIGWLWAKHWEMLDEFERTSKLLANIKTRVHPLNKELCDAVHKSVPEAEAKEIIFTEQERPQK